MRPQISVVIPLYNKAKTVIRAIQSIQSQKISDIEIIIVDDGSKDDGPLIVEQYKKTETRLQLVRQSNAGPGAARNRGISQASGHYLSFLDADDEYLPGFFASGLTVLEQNPDCKLFVSNHFRTRNGQQHSRREYFANFGVTEGKFVCVPNMDPIRLLGSLFFHHSGAIICESEIIRQFGGFYAEDRCLYGEDFFLWMQVMFNACGYHHLEPLVWYHSEDSQLFVEGQGKEIPAFLRDPERIRKACPSSLTSLLDDLLGVCTLEYIFSLIIGHDEKLPETTKELGGILLGKFPTSHKFEGYELALRYLGENSRKLRLPSPHPNPISWFDKITGKGIL